MGRRGRRLSARQDCDASLRRPARRHLARECGGRV